MPAIEPCADELVFESDLDAPPEKVWRAVTTPELRERWLTGTRTDPEPISTTPGEEVAFRLRDDAPPYLESTVVFQLRRGALGQGTRLTIIHRLTDPRLVPRTPAAANSNLSCRLRAA
ncbi:SRPBCC domain-containing protein [Microbaculum marinum]|uniref:SRPBCC domain-containing protein n=1 Tax=Microbaculum marinum TaxID=1764581 RepID=A0AAW9S4R9_9HYPH